jgi:hypothetical protein
MIRVSYDVLRDVTPQHLQVLTQSWRGTRSSAGLLSGLKEEERFDRGQYTRPRPWRATGGVRPEGCREPTDDVVLKCISDVNADNDWCSVVEMGLIISSLRGLLRW